MQLGQYEVIRSLGKGSFGEVFLARTSTSTGFAKQVAVKRLRESVVDDPALIERFAIEARICSFLSHPNIIEVYNFIKHEEGHLLVMEHLEGLELKQVMGAFRRERRLLPLRICLDLAVQLCEGLHFAHAATGIDGMPLGLVHRDIKPSNLMITRDGVLKIMDFGVARADFARTQSGIKSVKGTLQYMAPEQAIGGHIDATVDQYATALILAELLLGQPVYQASSENSLFFQVGTGAVEPTLAQVKTWFPMLHPILAQALSLNPADRFPDQQALASALKGVVQGLEAGSTVREIVRGLLEESRIVARVGVKPPWPPRPLTVEEQEQARLMGLARGLGVGALESISLADGEGSSLEIQPLTDAAQEVVARVSATLSTGPDRREVVQLATRLPEVTTPTTVMDVSSASRSPVQRIEHASKASLPPPGGAVEILSPSTREGAGTRRLRPAVLGLSALAVVALGLWWMRSHQDSPQAAAELSPVVPAANEGAASSRLPEPAAGTPARSSPPGMAQRPVADPSAGAPSTPAREAPLSRSTSAEDPSGLARESAPPGPRMDPRATDRPDSPPDEDHRSARDGLSAADGQSREVVPARAAGPSSVGSGEGAGKRAPTDPFTDPSRVPSPEDAPRPVDGSSFWSDSRTSKLPSPEDAPRQKSARAVAPDAGVGISESGRLLFRVIPASAAVVLDATGTPLDCRTGQGCPFQAGEYAIRVTHPDGRTQRLSVQIPGQMLVGCVFNFDASPPLDCPRRVPLSP